MAYRSQAQALITHGVGFSGILIEILTAYDRWDEHCRLRWITSSYAWGMPKEAVTAPARRYQARWLGGHHLALWFFAGGIFS